MGSTKVSVENVEQRAGAMRFLRDPLEAEQLGVTVVNCPPGWEGKPHDHADGGQEEIYYLVEGAATVDVDGEAVDLSGGDALRIDPESTRQIQNGDEQSTFVLAGAP